MRLFETPNLPCSIRLALTLVIALVSTSSSFGQLVFSTQTGGSGAATNILSPVPNSGILLLNYDFFALPDTVDVFYDHGNIFSSGPTAGAGQFPIPYGPGLSSSLTIILNQGASGDLLTVWRYTPSIVPEPSVLCLLGFGLVALFFRLRRQTHDHVG